MASKEKLSPLARPIESLFVGFIRVYQLLCSPFFGSCCRFYPCCSNYAIEAIRTHGCLAGTILAMKRISRCHPYSSGGVDPVPHHHPESSKQ